MTNYSSNTRILALAIGAVVLVGAGAVGMFAFLGGAREDGAAGATHLPDSTSPPAMPDQSPAVAAGIVVTISPELLARAGIATSPATRGPSTDGLRIPATVQPHGYRQVVVSSTSAGRVLSVAAQLGQQVQAGDALVRIHSPDAAETQRAYVSQQADLAALRLQVTRLERLATIGAASRQELEAARAQETGLGADLQSTRALLIQLGLSADQVHALETPAAIDATITVRAPIAGTVTSRSVNPGQTIDASATLFTVVDLGRVWIVGNVYERDLAGVRAGNPVTMTRTGVAGASFPGRVSYVDPEVAPDTRTAGVRVEVDNRGGRLRLGMLMEMRVSGSARDAVLIPRTAVQTIDGVDVVYIADAQRPGTFSERSVRLGAVAGEMVEVIAGIEADEPVVTGGSFMVRSERARMTLAPPNPAPAANPARAGAK